MKNKDFTITSYAWGKEVEDRLRDGGEDFDSEQAILERLTALASFLEKHGLVSRKLTNASGMADKNFVLKASFLTETGLALIKSSYVTWQKKAKTPNDVSKLEEGLRKLPK